MRFSLGDHRDNELLLDAGPSQGWTPLFSLSEISFWLSPFLSVRDITFLRRTCRCLRQIQIIRERPLQNPDPDNNLALFVLSNPGEDDHRYNPCPGRYFCKQYNEYLTMQSPSKYKHITRGEVLAIKRYPTQQLRIFINNNARVSKADKKKWLDAVYEFEILCDLRILTKAVNAEYMTTTKRAHQNAL